MATETKTFYPGAHEEFSGYRIDNATNPVGKGASNTSGASIYSAKNSTAICFWPFDVTAIPEKATIDSVSCVAGVKANTSGNSFSANVQLYSGNTTKGSAVSLANNNNNQKLTISGAVWTRAELGSIRLRTYFQNRGTYALSLIFYGADLTVTYTYQSEKFMLKLGGAWHDVARVFKKVNGVWIEQESLEGVVDTSKKLVNGGEIN